MASKDYDKMTVALLREELKIRDLSIEGKKADLIERLKTSDKEAEDELLNSSLGDDILPVSDLNAEDILLQTAGSHSHDKIDASDLLEGNKEQEKSKKRIERVSSAEEKIARAARLGLPISTSNTTHSSANLAIDAKANRAKRFGLSSDPVTNSDELKAKRIARFGITSIQSTHTNKLSTIDEETKERLLKRAQRFGLPVSSNGKTVHEDLSEDGAKKRARLERFGLPL